MGHWANEYVGIPWSPAGRDYDGADCWGLAYLVLRDKFGVDAPQYREYQDTNDVQALAGVVSDSVVQWSPVEPNQEQPGDVVLLRRGRLVCHVGIVVGGGWMLHLMPGSNACVESYKSAVWRHRVSGFYRYD